MRLTIEVAANGSVSIEFGGRMVSMSRFSDTAQVVAGELGTGTHVYAEGDDIPAAVLDRVILATA